MDKNTYMQVPALSGTNYYVWAMKMEATLTLKDLRSVLEEDEPAAEDAKRADWMMRNSNAVAYIRLALADEHALQYASINNARELWSRIKANYTGLAEDMRIDLGQELKNIKMADRECACDYVARARGLATKCITSGLEISTRELVYHLVRGLNDRFQSTREILKTQRDKSVEEVLEILREKEAELESGGHGNKKGGDAAYSTHNGQRKFVRRCYVCKQPDHIAKFCPRKKKNQGGNNQKQDNGNNSGNKKATLGTQAKMRTLL